MILRRKQLKESPLYLILDKKTAGRLRLPYIVSKINEICPRARKPAVGIVQFRDKQSNKEAIIKDAIVLHKLLLNSGTLFIINDYLDVAKVVDSDGLHIGQSDVSIETARQILGPDKIIGVSCHNLKQALIAQEKGADYIGFGPLFPTPTKSEYKPIGLKLIKKLNREIRIPFFVIGDVNQNNIHKIVLSGAKRVAVCRAILSARNIPAAVKQFSEALYS